jgi:hypothetical protein
MAAGTRMALLTSLLLLLSPASLPPGGEDAGTGRDDRPVVVCSAYVPSTPPGVQRNTKNTIHIGGAGGPGIDISRVLAETEEALLAADAHGEWKELARLIGRHEQRAGGGLVKTGPTAFRRTDVEFNQKSVTSGDGTGGPVESQRDSMDDTRGRARSVNTDAPVEGHGILDGRTIIEPKEKPGTVLPAFSDPFDISDVLAQAHAALEAVRADDDDDEWKTLSHEIMTSMVKSDEVVNRNVRLALKDDVAMGRKLWDMAGKMFVERSKDAVRLAQDQLHPNSRLVKFSKEVAAALQDQAVHTLRDHFVKDSRMMTGITKLVENITSEATIKMRKWNIDTGGVTDQTVFPTVRIGRDMKGIHLAHQKVTNGAFGFEHHINQVQAALKKSSILAAPWKEGWVDRFAQPFHTDKVQSSESSIHPDGAKVAVVSSNTTGETSIPPSDSIRRAPSINRHFFMKESFLSKSHVTTEVPPFEEREEVASTLSEKTTHDQISPVRENPTMTNPAPAFVAKATKLKSNSTNLVDSSTPKRRLSPVAELAAKLVKIWMQDAFGKLFVLFLMRPFDVAAPNVGSQPMSARFALETVYLSRLARMVLPRTRPLSSSSGGQHTSSSEAALQPRIPYFARSLHQ